MNERFLRAADIARVDLAHEPDFALGSVEVRPALRELACNGWNETIDRRVMQVLVALARAKGKVVSRDDLIESCWGGVIVGEDAINNCVSRLRKAADACGSAFLIETVPRVGYRLRISGAAATAAESLSGVVPTRQRTVQSAPGPRRTIYRGLQSLDEQDAPIFFGRDAPIAQALDELRRMREGSAKSMLVILGASGAGKSSFLKAGLLARLKRDEENFIVLPVIRPERAALTGARGLAASLSSDASRFNKPEDLVELFARLRAGATARVRRAAEGPCDSSTGRPHTIVIPIDQAEELFAAENREAGHVLSLLAGAVRADPDTLIVATIRSDAFEKLQSEPRLADVQLLPFSLAPLPHGAFKEVIEGPARLADPPLTIEPALTEQLLRDLAASDALPLLAFTLERLWLRHRGGGTLTLPEYVEDLGGLRGAITAAVDAAFAEAQRDPAMPNDRAELERLTRTAFIPSLVQLDDADGEPRRRVERANALPPATLPMVRHLIDQRLLVSDWSTIDGIENDTVEVAHEAILRQWPTLRIWIAEERDALRSLEGVRAAAAEWYKHANSEHPERSESWLTHRGGRLQEADTLISRPGFSNALNVGEIDYLSACWATENAERLRERKAIARTRRLQRNIGGVIAVAAIVVLLAAAGIMQVLTGMVARTTVTLGSLAGTEAEAGNYDRAARYALAGLARGDWPLLDVQSSETQAELLSAANASPALAVVRGHDNSVESAAFSPDGARIVTASDDKTARIWDAKTGHEIAVMRGFDNEVIGATFSPDGTRIVTASFDKTARIWDAKSAHAIAVLRGHDGFIEWADFSADGTRIVTASADKTARIWDAKTAHEIAVLRGHDGVVEWAAFSPDGTRIVTASADKTARIWDAQTAQEIAVLRGHDGTVYSAAFSPDGTQIVTASADRTARIWDAKTARTVVVLHGHDSVVMCAAFSPDGTHVVTASGDKTARIWDAKTANEIAILRGHDDILIHAGFSPDGTRIVTASYDKTARIWDANALHRIAILRGHDDALRSAAFSPDGMQVVTASDDRTARIWDAKTAHEIAVLRGHDGTVYKAAFSPDGTRIVSASADNTARIWDAKTAREIATLRGHDSAVWSAAFSPDGTRIVTASFDKTARIWEAKTARQIAVLHGHDGAVFSAAFSPDGTRVVTASWDKSARIWDARTAREIAVLRGHDGFVEWAEFSADGARIVTASADKTARIWDANTAREIAVLRGHDDSVRSASFSPDGARIVTASWDRTARIWNVSGMVSVPRADAIRHACETTLANGLSKFSEQELRAAPELDPRLDTDACHPPSFWARLGRIFTAALEQ